MFEFAPLTVSSDTLVIAGLCLFIAAIVITASIYALMTLRERPAKSSTRSTAELALVAVEARRDTGEENLPRQR